MHRLRPVGMVKPPFYFRKGGKLRKPLHWLFEEFPNAGVVSGSGPRLYDYYKMAEYVKELPTPMERINFVSPYERPWNWFERKWHREFLSPLYATRKAWSIPRLPLYFDVLEFYKYITKSRVISSDEANILFEKYFKPNNVSSDSILHFEDRILQSLTSLLCSTPTPSKDETSGFLKTIIEDAYFTLSRENSNLKSIRVSYSPRCDSFWVRSGFKKLYSRQNIFSGEIKRVGGRFTGDDRRKLGELSFTMRDEFVSQVRTQLPIKNIFDLSETKEIEAPIFSSFTNINEEIILNPKMYNLFPDGEILWQCPGYDADVVVEETHKFGCVAVKNSADFHKSLKFWNPDSEDEKVELRHDFYVSTAISSLFNWLNGQAHCLGNTQYTDIEKPLTSQLIISDGKEVWFAIAQLNTIAINIDVEGFMNNRTNFCCVDGPYNLYDEFDQASNTFKFICDGGKLKNGLNFKVLQRILQMCSNY